MNVPSPRETLPHSTLYRSERASQQLASSFASPPPSAGSCAAAFDAALLAAPLAPVACAHAVLPSITASTKLTDATALSHCPIENSPRVLQVPTVQIGRASCRERVSVRVDLGGRRTLKKKKQS